MTYHLVGGREGTNGRGGEPPLPYSARDERAVLGAVLLEPAALVQVADWLRAEDFYFASHRLLYETMLALWERGTPPTLELLAARLEQAGRLSEVQGMEEYASLSGFGYLVQLTFEVTGSWLVEQHARNVVELAVWLGLIRAGSQIVAWGHAREENALSRSEQLLYQLAERGVRSRDYSLAEVLQELASDLDRMHHLRLLGQRVLGVPTGIERLDFLMGGLTKTDLTVIAARPGVGKSALALGIAKHAAQEGCPVYYLSIEMGRKQLAQRVLAEATSIDQARLRVGELFESTRGAGGGERFNEWERVVTAIDTLSDLPVWINDASGLTMLDIRSRAMRMKRMHGIALLVIDYLQLIVPRDARGASRQQLLGEITRGLKALARELDLPILALAQLSRAAEGYATPTLAHLRESGDIESDADNVALAWIDNAEDDELRRRGQPHLVKLLLAKQRNGPLGEATLRFIPNVTRFRDESGPLPTGPDGRPDLRVMRAVDDDNDEDHDHDDD